MKKFYLIFAVISAMLIACEKEAIQIQEPTDSSKNIEGIQVGSENGYLVFNTFQDVFNFMKNVQNFNNVDYPEQLRDLEYTSAYEYFETNSELLELAKNDEDMMRVANEMIMNGYINKDNSVCYPFDLYNWIHVVNEKGLIKIGNTIYRLFGKDRLYNDNNDLSSLLAVKGEQDYLLYNIKLANESFPILKATDVTLPGDGGQLIEGYDLVTTITLGEYYYRTTTNVYYEEWSYYDGITTWTLQQDIGVKTEIHRKKISGGIFWYKEYDTYFTAIYDNEIGGNLAVVGDPDTYYPKVDIHENYPEWVEEGYNWFHVKYLYNCSYMIPYYNRIYPEFTYVLLKYKTSNNQQSQWIELY